MDELELIGGGSMGTALLHGLLSHGLVRAEQVSLVEVDGERRKELALLFPGVTLLEQAVGAPQVIVATKPNHVVEALTSLRNLGVKRVLSIAAGINIATLEAAIGPQVAVIRAMPNTPALVQQGATALFANSFVSQKQRDMSAKVLGAVSKKMYWLPLGSHCAYIDSAIKFAVSSVTSPSSNSTIYSLVSRMGFSLARPIGLPFSSRLRLVTRPLHIVPPLGKMISVEM